MKYPTGRDQKIVEARAQGMTFEAIAALFGYSSRQAAHKAHERAMRKFPSPSVENVRAEADELDNWMRRELMKTVEDPGHKVSATGHIVWDISTCSCGVREGIVADARGHTRRVPHAPDCQVVPEVDHGARIRAVDQLRKLSDDKVSRYGARKPGGKHLAEDIARAQMEAWLLATREHYEAQVTVLPLREIPSGKPED